MDLINLLLGGEIEIHEKLTMIPYTVCLSLCRSIYYVR
jgi:hypothetical protein